MAGNEIQLVQEHFDDLIERRGKLVTWRAAYRCSCWHIASGAPNYDCKACGGVGFIYQTPYTVKAVVQGLDTKKDFLPTGEWHMGDMTCSVPNKLLQVTPGPTGNIRSWLDNPMWNIGEWDLITIPNSEQRTSENLIKGQALWRRPADTMVHPPEAVLEVKAVLVADPIIGTVTMFTPGVVNTDFTLSGGVVTWLPGSTKDYTTVGNVVKFNPNGAHSTGLPNGAQYSITYTHLTTYIVYMQIPTARDVDNQHFPRKVVLRLKDVGAQ